MITRGSLEQADGEIKDQKIQIEAVHEHALEVEEWRIQIQGTPTKARSREPDGKFCGRIEDRARAEGFFTQPESAVFPLLTL